MSKGLDRARQDLHGLLSRFERNPDAARLGIAIRRETFASQAELDDYLAEMHQAGTIGALRVEARRGKARHDPPSISLSSPTALYSYLDRSPRTVEATAAINPLRSKWRLPWHKAALDDVERTWSRGKSWWGIDLQCAHRLDAVAALATEIVLDRHLGLDYRSISVQVAGDSKFLERHESAVLRFLSFGRTLPQGGPRAALSELGLDRLALPLHLSGPIALDGRSLPAALPYIAIPHAAMSLVDFHRTPRCLLVVENFVSFHRHAVECNAQQTDLVIYCGGQPSLAWQRSVRALRDKVPQDIPCYHWSDIDAGGLEIFRTIERLLGRVEPHLMSMQIAESAGTAAGGALTREGQFAGSAIGALADYLSSDKCKWVEQEALDPVAPGIYKAST